MLTAGSGNQTRGKPPIPREIPDSSTPQHDVRAQLGRILASQGFVRSGRLSSFLRFVVEQTLEGHSARLKEYTVGIEIYARGESYDPQSESIVRVEASRLRQKLADYYRNEGRNDSILIELPQRTYVPVFRRRDPEPPVADPPAVESATIPAPERPPSKFQSWITSPGGWRLTPLSVVSLGIGGAALICAILLALRTAPRPDGNPGTPRSVLVLPFTDLSQTRDQEYYADGLTEEVIDALANFQGLRVISRTSAFQFKGKMEDVRKIGAGLKADVVLEGSLRKQGNRVRIIAQLINVADGYHLWSRAFDRPADNAFDIEQDVAQGIARALRVSLGDLRRGQRAERLPHNVDARDAFLKGLYFSRQWSQEGLSRSIANFEEAIRLDAGFARAHAELAEIYAVLAIHAGLPPREIMPKAKAEAERALALDASIPEAHGALGLVHGVYDWDWAAAERDFKRAHELDPNNVQVHEAYVMAYLLPTARLDEALSQIRDAQSLDPVSPRIHSVAGLVYYYRREYDQAAEQFRKALELDPNFHAAQLGLGSIYEAKRLYPEALSAISTGRKAWASGIGRSFLGHTYALMGKQAEARALCDELTKVSATRYIPPAYIALIHFALGEKDQGFEWLEKAYEQRSATLAYLKVNPRYDAVRSDPRFAVLLNRIGL